MKIARKMGRKKWKMMGQDVLNGASFIGIAGDRVMIHFPRKKVHFCFNSPCNPGMESRSQKGEV
jgi:hypothetical protein